MKDKLVSVIMPVFNGEKTILRSVASILEQVHQNLEIIIINDGSTDRTENLLSTIDDPRIVLINQENGGVSSARNAGLQRMKGDFFCFLDADDYMMPHSVSSRLQKFISSDEIWYVDGIVDEINSKNGERLRRYIPSFKGAPLKELLLIKETCFCGQTWMIRSVFQENMPRFTEGQTHGEDLNFFIECAKYGGKYDFVSEVILQYNRSPDSAMSNIKGLENFYRSHLGTLKQHIQTNLISVDEWNLLKKRIKKILIRSYLKKGEILGAIRQFRL